MIQWSLEDPTVFTSVSSRFTADICYHTGILSDSDTFLHPAVIPYAILFSIVFLWQHAKRIQREGALRVNQLWRDKQFQDFVSDSELSQRLEGFLPAQLLKKKRSEGEEIKEIKEEKKKKKKKKRETRTLDYNAKGGRLSESYRMEKIDSTEDDTIERPDPLLMEPMVFFIFRDNPFFVIVCAACQRH